MGDPHEIGKQLQHRRGRGEMVAELPPVAVSGAYVVALYTA